MKVLITKTAKLLVRKFSFFLAKHYPKGDLQGASCPDPYGTWFLPPPNDLPDTYGFLPWKDETCDPPQVEEPPEPPNPPLC